MYRREQYRAAFYPYIVDLPLALLALSLADWLRHTLAIGLPIEPGTVYLTLPVYALVTGVWLALYPRLVRLEAARRTPLATELGLVAFGVTTSTLCFASLLYLAKVENFSRVLFGYFYLLTLLFTFGARLGLRWLWHRRTATGESALRAMVVAAPDTAARLAAALATESGGEIRIAGYAGPPGPPGSPPRLGCAEECADLVRTHGIQAVYIALDASQRDLALCCVYDLQDLPVHVYVVPDFVDLFSARATLHLVGGIPLLGLRAPVLSAWDAALKRVFDVAVSSVLLVCLAPIMLLIALAIKLDSPGPIFFVQERIGENGRPFRMYKFRSMVANAEDRLEEVVDLDALPEPAFKLRHDPRVTRVGRFLRRTSLDELPQLWNVWRGEMSLVGPRPEEARIVARYSPWHRKRLAVKPGVTGPMQVNGRGDLSLDERVRLELHYIQHYSLWQDLCLLARTLPAVLSGRGSY
jgi:exopolysaccharide biosynthesis polyprenyl glycosylphosphotransferase